MPVPHDCVIKHIHHKDQCIEFVFEDDIAYHDSIRYLKPDARSLIIRYHFAYDMDDYSVYEWIKPFKLFAKDGYYKRIDNRRLTELPEGKFKLEYLYHNAGYCSIITKLYANKEIILDADVDYVEFEWLC